MKGTVIAVSRRLGTAVVQFEPGACTVFELPGYAGKSVEVETKVSWQPADDGWSGTLVQWPHGAEVPARVQRQGVTRGEALSSMAVI